MLTRRRALLSGFALAGTLCAPSLGYANAPAQRLLRFHNLHTGEVLDAEYCINGQYDPGALSAINHVLRDHRTDDIHAIDVRLLDLLSDLGAQLEARTPFQVISGYRSPRTNASLAAASDGVARHSLHMEGMAIDIALEDVSIDAIQQAALELGRGGVGYYPDPGFVHIDVGRVRRW